MLPNSGRKMKAKNRHRYKSDFDFQSSHPTYQNKLRIPFQDALKNTNLSFPSLQVKTNSPRVPVGTLSLRNSNFMTEKQEKKQKMVVCQKIDNIQAIKTQRKVHFVDHREEQNKNIKAWKFRISMGEKSSNKQAQIGKELKYLKGKLIIKQIPRLLSRFSRDQFQRLNKDLNFIGNLFGELLQERIIICQSFDSQLTTDLGKLVFFMGLQLEGAVKKEENEDEWLDNFTKCLHQQIYYGILLKMYPLALETLLQCARLYSNEKRFEESEYFCEVALKMAVNEQNQYYEESALEQIGLCQYKRGKLDEARIIHENISNVSTWSKKHLQKFYDEEKYLNKLRGYIFNGGDLAAQRSMKLIETVVFNQNLKGESKKSGAHKSADRLAISSTNKSINEFRIKQERTNDLRKESNEIAIKSIRFKHLYKIQEQAMKGSLENKKTARPTKSLTFQIHNNVMKTHESLNRSQDKNSKRRLPQLQRNMKLFLQFLQCIRQSILQASEFLGVDGDVQ